MKDINFLCRISEGSINELAESDKTLIQSAVNALKSSYSPYSKFRVGAAVLLEDGKIVLGSNQENAAFPSGLCAERVAIFSAASNYYQQKIIAIAITTEKLLENPAAPCGDCRQVLLEYELKQGTNIKVLLFQGEKVFIINSMKELLPLHFTLL